jgi:hypothetical protein
LPDDAAASRIPPVWRRKEVVLDRATLDGILLNLMSIDAKLVRLVDELLEDDGEAEADT